MAKDKDKLIASAQKLAQRGQTEKAIKELLKVLEIDRKDVKVHLRLGDLYSKVKKKEEAIKHYLEASKHYTKTGFYSKAIAVYKRVLELDEHREDVYLNMADLYQRMGMVGDAMNYYQKVAERYELDGNLKEALDIYRQMAELDPRNVINLTKLAEIYYKNGLKKEGYQVFRRALDELKEQNRFEDYVRLMEKLAKADPENTENLRELADIYIRRKAYERAYAILTRLIQQKPDDAKSLSDLAQVCIKLERKDEAITRLKELAKVYQSQGFRQRAREALQKVLQLDPNDPLAKKALGAQAEAPSPPPSEPEVVELDEEVAEEVTEEVVEVGAEEEEIEELEEAVEEEAVITAPEEEHEEVPEHLTPEQIQEHLVEADVYLKYGLRDKALTHIQSVLKVDPENLEALQRLKNIELEKKNQDRAIAILKQMGEIAQRNSAWEILKSASEEILSYQPDDSSTQSWLQLAEENLAKAPEPAPAVSEPEVVEEEMPEVIEEAEVEMPEEVVEEEAMPEVVEEEPATGMEKTEAVEEVTISQRTEQAPDFSEEIEEAEFYAQQGLEEEALRVYLEILEKDPTNKQAVRRVQELEKIVKEKQAREEAVSEPAPARVEETAPAPPESAEPSPVEVEIEEEEYPEVIEEEVVMEETASEPAEEIPRVIEEEAPPEPIASAPAQEEVEEEARPIPAEPEAEIKPSAPEIAGEEIIEEEVTITEEAVREEPVLEFKEEEAPAEPEKEMVLEPEPPAVSPPPEPPTALEPEPSAVSPQPESPTALEPEPPAPPSSPAEEQVISEPEVSPPPPPSGPEAEFFSSEEEGLFDLAAELEKEDFEPAPQVEGLSTAEKYSFEDMFKQFKEGVSKVVSDEDASTHYDLGIAYKEMGLYDDAIQEFEKARQAGYSPADCYLMVGLCYAERGKYEKAIEEFEKGLGAPGVSNAEKAAFFYELAQSWTGLGDLPRGLKMFEKCQNLEPGFRDVETQIQKLQDRLKGAPAPEPSAPSREEVSWESAALEEPQSEAEPEKEEEKKKKKGKKIGYV